MTPVANRLLLCIPAVLTFGLQLLAAVPWGAHGMSLAPNVLLLMTLTLGVAYPIAWPPLLAFGLGLIADTLLGTPLGVHALLATVLTLALRSQARRLEFQPVRVRWMQAALALLVVHGMMWAVMGWVQPAAPPLSAVVRATLVNALWFPVFYYGVNALAQWLPSRS